MMKSQRSNIYRNKQIEKVTKMGIMEIFKKRENENYLWNIRKIPFSIYKMIKMNKPNKKNLYCIKYKIIVLVLN